MNILPQIQMSNQKIVFLSRVEVILIIYIPVARVIRRNITRGHDVSWYSQLTRYYYSMYNNLELR